MLLTIKSKLHFTGHLLEILGIVQLSIKIFVKRNHSQHELCYKIMTVAQWMYKNTSGQVQEKLQ